MYKLLGDVVDEFGGSPSPLHADPCATLQDARDEYKRIKSGLDVRGFRLAHARIVGPQHEVYDVEEDANR